MIGSGQNGHKFTDHSRPLSTCNLVQNPVVYSEYTLVCKESHISLTNGLMSIALWEIAVCYFQCKDYRTQHSDGDIKHDTGL